METVFFMLLTLTLHSEVLQHVIATAEFSVVKTIGSKPDVTPVCSNSTENIMFIVCKIRTERNQGEECRLWYHYKDGFELGCDSRFTLKMENHTIFLHLTSLTPVDSGNHTCECSYAYGTSRLHLNITVEEDEDTSSPTENPPVGVIIGAVLFIVLGGLLLGVISKKIHQGRRREPVSGRSIPEPHTAEAHRMTFLQRENDLYSSNIICSHGNDYNSVYDDVIRVFI